MAAAGSHTLERLNGRVTGVTDFAAFQNPDTVKLEELKGYEYERGVVVENTLDFLEGGSANNLLLYGDRGTGKSSTVKAVFNAYRYRGLRIIEVTKEIYQRFSSYRERDFKICR